MVFRSLPEELARIAEKELNEHPARIVEDLRHLREWLAKQPHLNVRDDDQWLVAFLRGCKHSLHRVKDKIDGFYTVRTLTPEYFTNRDPLLPEMQEIFKNGYLYVVLNDKKFLGPRTICIDCSALNYHTVTLDNLFKVTAMGAEILMLEDDNFTVSGVSVLINLKGFNINYLSQCTPTFFKKCVTIGLEAYPIRIKNICYINAPDFLHSCFQIFKLFLSSKMKERIFVFNESNSDKLYQHIPRAELPFEMGGECGSSRDMIAYSKEKIESYRKWLLEDETYRSDETKRIGSHKMAQDLFGVDGSFRKLDID